MQNVEHTNPAQRTLNTRQSDVNESMCRVFLFVGIDPGVNTGFAVWNAEAKQLTRIHTTDFWGAINTLQSMHDGDETFAVFIENPRGVSGMYDRHDQFKGRVRTRIAQNVGSNKRDAQLLTEWCERNNIPVFPLTPNKHSMTGMNQKSFKEYTGWQQSTSEHARDAAMLVHNREPLIIRNNHIK